MRKRLLFLGTLLVFWLFGGVFMLQSFAAPTQPLPVEAEIQIETRDYKNSVPLILDKHRTSLPSDVFIYNNGRKNHRY